MIILWLECFGDSHFFWFFSLFAMNTGVKRLDHCVASPEIPPGLLRTLRALRTAQFAWQAEEARICKNFGDIFWSCSRGLPGYPS